MHACMVCVAAVYAWRGVVTLLVVLTRDALQSRCLALFSTRARASAPLHTVAASHCLRRRKDNDNDCLPAPPFSPALSLSLPRRPLPLPLPPPSACGRGLSSGPSPFTPFPRRPKQHIPYYPVSLPPNAPKAADTDTDTAASTADTVASTADTVASTADTGASTADTGASTADTGASTADTGASTAAQPPAVSPSGRGVDHSEQSPLSAAERAEAKSAKLGPRWRQRLWASYGGQVLLLSKFNLSLTVALTSGTALQSPPLSRFPIFFLVSFFSFFLLACFRSSSAFYELSMHSLSASPPMCLLSGL